MQGPGRRNIGNEARAAYEMAPILHPAQRRSDTLASGAHIFSDG